MGPDDIGAERLGHGYAITAHRSQGSTVDVAHVLDDGGGRELAYVAMSRARTASHVYVTALDPRPSRRAARLGMGPATPPTMDHRPPPDSPPATAARHRRAGRANGTGWPRPIPPDVTDQLTRLRHQIAQVEADRADLHAGTGRWADTPVGHAHQALQDAQRSHDHDLRPGPGPLSRAVGPTPSPPSRTSQRHQPSPKPTPPGRRPSDPTTTNSASRLDRLGSDARTLEAAQQARTDFLAAHPDIVDRISEIDHAITQQHRLPVQQTRPPIQSTRRRPPTPPPSRPPPRTHPPPTNRRSHPSATNRRPRNLTTANGHQLGKLIEAYGAVRQRTKVAGQTALPDLRVPMANGATRAITA